MNLHRSRLATINRVRRIASAITLTAAAFAATPQVNAQTTAPADAAPQAVERLSAKITSLKGVVQVRETEDQPWKPAEVGMTLGEGAEFRTGPRSAVQFVIPPDQTITLDRLGTIKLLQAALEQGKVTTDLGMKYGRTRYDIQAVDLKHASTIHSPGSTLAIRGTDVTYEDQAPWQPSAVCRTGRAMFKNARHDFVAFGGKRPAAVNTAIASPGEQAMVQTRADPNSAFSGRTGPEAALLSALPSQGGADLKSNGIQQFHNQAQGTAAATQIVMMIPTPTPTPTPTPMPDPTPTSPLSFLAVWRGTPYADVDLSIARGGNELLLPGGTTTTGGFHTGNTKADASGFGFESAGWSPTYPPDYYLVRLQLKNNASVTADVDVRALSSTSATDGGTSLAVIQNVVLDARNPFFQQLVAAPADLGGTPPPLPNPPPVGPLPEPTPDTTQVAGVATKKSSSKKAKAAAQRAREMGPVVAGFKARK